MCLYSSIYTYKYCVYSIYMYIYYIYVCVLHVHGYELIGPPPTQISDSSE